MFTFFEIESCQFKFEKYEKLVIGKNFGDFKVMTKSDGHRNQFYAYCKFEQELKFVNDYIALEKLRCDHSYSISIEHTTTPANFMSRKYL